MQPLGIAVLSEELRPETRETIAFLTEQGVEVIVLSGDAPATVAAIAADAGIPVRGHEREGRDLPDDDLELDRCVAEIGVVGRVSPEGKRRVIESLKRRGRYVAMVGDGVNDVPALKASRLSIAQGSGAQMAKAVADVVLVRGDFAAVPGMVAEGRRILRNIQRVTKLFVTKSVFAAFLIVAIGITPAEYPLLPRHLTIVGALTVGIPAFFLALAPSDGPWRTDGFLRDVARFAVPAGVAAGLGVLTTYLIALNVFDLGLLQSRTAATTTLVIIGLYLVLALEATSRNRARAVATMCALLFAAYLLVLILPALRTFFELAVPNAAAIVLILVGCAIAIGFLWLQTTASCRCANGTDEPPGYDGWTMTTETVTPLDAALLRADFAFLDDLTAGKPLAYLDSASSTQKPRQVLDRMRAFYEHEYANVHRGVYRLAERATEGYEEARLTVSAFVNASSEREIVFTRSATESINLVAYAWGLQNLGPGDTVLITELEHHANFVPWQFIASRTGASFRHIPIDDAGELQLDALDELARDNSIKVVGVGLVRTRSGRSTRSSGSPRGRTTRARSSSSTRPRRRRTGGSTCRRSAATSSRCRRTSCAARAGSGLSGAVRRSSSPWPRSTSAAR